jgi:hypothetical protein
MALIKTHGNELRRLQVLPVDMPTLDTPWSKLNPWFRRNVLPKLDIRAKWMGCWMWTGATDSRGEPRFSYTSIKREKGRFGKRKTGLVKTEMLGQMKCYDASKVPWRRYKGDSVDHVPDMDIVHLCGNPSCLNPNHLIVCLDDAKHRDVEELRDRYLAPGTYWNGAPQ